MSSWIYSIICTAIFCSIMLALIPEGRVKSAARVVASIALLASVILPLKNMDFKVYSETLSQYRAEAEDITGKAQSIGDELNRKCIEERCSAYILDKAESLGAEINSVKVSLEWSEQGFWYPTGVQIESACEEDKKLKLMNYIESELGIENQAQQWKDEP